MRTVSDKSGSENQNIHCEAGQATDDNMAHAHCLLNYYGYKLTLRIGNINCFLSATKFARTLLNFMLYAHWLSCYYPQIVRKPYNVSKKVHIFK